ncbi:MAG TPA: hypothetical protein VEX63_09820 [Flavisolibacter sp.]|nr:hypothetical protein [Flavisolibacter sp.]
MSLTKLQQRRLQQTKDEMAHLKEKVARASLLLVAWFTLIWVTLFLLFDILFEMSVDKISFSQAWNNSKWTKLAFQFLIWFVFHYFTLIKWPEYSLKAKQKELDDLKHRYGADEI